jgi:TRAP-type mannitol/chloroaromatic compound transport system permease large subunit
MCILEFGADWSEWSLYILPSLAPLATVHLENILLGVLLEVELTEVW